jgi:hypothetical protein
VTREARNRKKHRCIYCGAPTAGQLTCASHRDLEAVDSELAGDAPAPIDAEQDAPNQWTELERGRRRRRSA